jgi:endoglucanase
MNDHGRRALEILEELGRRPAAPFHEGGPARYLAAFARDLGVDVQVDSFGNVIAHYRKGSDDDRPPVAYVAHMDHPGYEIAEIRDDGVVVRALGGVPAASLRKRVPVQILMPDGSRPRGELTPPDAPLSDDPSQRLTLLQVEGDITLEPGLPVIFDLPDFELDGDYIKMRALDDLAGCAATAAALERLVHESADADLYAVFTRAEEGGLFGARLLAEAGTLPLDTLVVSIESSPVIQGVAQGDGPVIRTGDAMYTFDAEAEQILAVAVETIRERDPDFKHQRRLMSGGSCEGTAFAVFGYRATGLAFPLVNHHNATTSIPDPDGDVGAETIAFTDFLGGVELLAEAATTANRIDDSPVRQRIRTTPDDVRRRLEGSVGW